MDDVKLNGEDLLIIEQWHKNIYEKGKLGNDLMQLLWDGVESLKHNLFFASIGIFTVFLEKYVRDKLIWLEFTQTHNPANQEGYFEYLEEIEEKIEDGKDEYKKRYMFPVICDKLVQHGKIEEHISIQLKEIYEKIRIPVQHGIYGRIVRENIGKHTVPVNKISVPENPTAEDLIALIENAAKEPLNDKLNINNPIFRMFLLPRFFKNGSLNLLKALSELVDIFDDKK